jgi:phasin family protein
MPDAKVPVAEDSAEKAYATASESLTAAPAASQVEVATPEKPAEAVAAKLDASRVESPAKAKRERKPAAAPIEATPAAKVVAPKAKSGGKAKAVEATAVKARPAKAQAVKPKPVRKAALSRTAPKPPKISGSNTKDTHTISQLKDKIMATATKTPDFTKNIQDAIADAQEKAKAAFEKSTASLGEITEFTKGNVEALVESGKILAAGAQDLGSTYVADSRAAFETLTAEVKELASAKNPTDFVKLQGDLMRRSFDAAVAAGSKNSEAMLKLVNEAFAPISGRVSLALDKAKTAA